MDGILTKVENVAAMLGLMVALASYPFGGLRLALSAFVGAVIVIVNFRVLHVVVRRAFFGEVGGKLVLLGALAMFKFVALVGLIALAVSAGHLDPTGLILGVSALVLAVPIAAIAAADPATAVGRS